MEETSPLWRTMDCNDEQCLPLFGGARDGDTMQVKEAVELATRQLPEVFPASQGRELTLEGVEKTEDSRFWKITLSYTAGDEGFEKISREYKTVKLRDSDGEFMGARTGF